MAKAGGRTLKERLSRRADAFVNEALERNILSLCVSDRRVLEACASMLLVEDFSTDAHRAIWISLAKMAESGSDPNAISLWAEMERGGLGHHVGTLSDLADYLVPDEGYDVRQVSSYCSSLRSYTLARKQKELGDAMVRCASSPMDASDRADWIRRAADEVAALAWRNHALEGMSDLLVRVDVNDFVNPSRREVYIETPWRSLNEILIGFRVGRLYVIGAYTSHGKTSFALNLAIHAAVVKGVPVAYFPLEMEGEEMFRLAACNLAGVSNMKVARGALDQDEIGRFSEAVERLKSSPLKVANLYGHSVSEIRAAIHRERSDGNNIQFVVVDHMQLMRTAKAAHDMREAFTRIGNDLLETAMEMRVCILALSQLRKPDRKVDKRPTIEDFRETSAFAEAATAAGVLYRPEFFKVNGDRSRVILYLDKNRGGRTGKVELRAIDKYCRYEESVIQSGSDDEE